MIKNFVYCVTMAFFLSISAFAQIEVHDAGKVSIGGNPAARPGCEAFVNGSASGYSLFVQHNNFSPWSCCINTNVLDPNCCSYGLDMNGANVYYVSANGWIFCGGNFISSDSP
jgi:hypothetical protein